MSNFDEFRKKEKFTREEFYPGLTDLALRQSYMEKVNLAADDFQRLVLSGNASDADFQEVIEIGLQRFEYLLVDTEDRERICAYFEELMDMVGLESSGGHLNRFVYGFDPLQ